MNRFSTIASLASIVFITFCCASPKPERVERVERVERAAEHWTIVWDESADKALEARPEWKHLSNTYPATPALDRGMVKIAAMRTLKRIYKPYNISFEWGGAGEVQTATIAFERAEPRDIGTFWLGIANRIDHRNKRKNDRVSVWANDVVQVMRFDPLRGLDPEGVPTSMQVGTAIGNTLAHEIGHALGMRHMMNELLREDAYFVMSPGLNSYSILFLYGQKWREVHKVYLETILGKR